MVLGVTAAEGQGLPATPPPRDRRPCAAAAGAGVTDPHEGRRQGGRAGPDSGRRARSRESPSPRRRRIAPPAHRGEACNPAPTLGIGAATEPLAGEARAAAPLDRVQPGLAGTGEPRLDDGEPPRRLGLPRRPIARRPGGPARRRCQRRATLAPDRRQLREIVHGGTGYQAWSRSAPGAATRSRAISRYASQADAIARMASPGRDPANWRRPRSPQTTVTALMRVLRSLRSGCSASVKWSCHPICKRFCSSCMVIPMNETEPPPDRNPLPAVHLSNAARLRPARRGGR